MRDKKYPSTLATRWTTGLTGPGRGFTPVVTAFIEHAGRKKGRAGGKLPGLGLNPTQALLVIHLMHHKRDARMPFPAIGTLAMRMGVSDTTVRNNLDALHKAKLVLKRSQRGRPNFYDLTPLFSRLEEIQTESDTRKAAEKVEVEAKRLPESYNLDGFINHESPVSS